MVVELSLREATPADISVLVNHRRRMFEDMASLNDDGYDPADLDSMDEAYARQLRTRLLDGTLQAWVLESGGQIVASGSIFFSTWLPRPRDLTECLAYLHSVYTVPEYRRRGLARQIVQTAVEACRARGLKRVMLHASDAGRPLYESLGFRQTDEMRLVLT
jgi:GNAT superfamily N-acetyltransferase